MKISGFWKRNQENPQGEKIARKPSPSGKSWKKGSPIITALEVHSSSTTPVPLVICYQVLLSTPS